MTRLIVVLMLMSNAASAAPRILVHGHRGARAVLPENTLPAFEYAIRVGTDVLEMDLAVTKDNVLVVSHDPELDKKICTAPAGMSTVIRELTLDQVKQWDCGTLKNPDYPKQKPVPGTRIPTLDEVLALAPRGSFEFNIETKIFASKPHLTPDPETFARLLVDLVRKHKLESRVMIQSFDFRTLHAAKRIAPEIRLSALDETGMRNYVTVAREAGAGIISPQHFLLRKGRVDEAHKAGLQVVPWTANKESDWDRLIDAGVDAIISDDPEALIAHLKKRGIR